MKGERGKDLQLAHHFPGQPSHAYFKDFFLFMYMYVCLSDCMEHVFRYLLRPAEGFASLGAGIRSGCEPPEVGAGNQTEILYRSNK